MREKLKLYLQNDQIFYALVVILVGLASFGLGRASVSGIVGIAPATVIVSSTKDVPLPKTLTSKPNDTALTASLEKTAESVVASKSGTKYHLSNCPGAKQIKAENLISFPSRASAEAAGYTPAANCPGLK